MSVDDSENDPIELPHELQELIFWKSKCKERVKMCATEKKKQHLCRDDRHIFMCLREQLDSDDPNAVRGALRALGKLGSLAREHVEAIAKKLKDDTYSTEAIEALGDLGEVAVDHVDAVVDCLKETNLFLASIHNGTKISKYLRNVERKAAAIRALGKFGERIIQDKELVDVVEKIISDFCNSFEHRTTLSFDDRETHRACIQMFGGLGNLKRNSH